MSNVFARVRVEPLPETVPWSWWAWLRSAGTPAFLDSFAFGENEGRLPGKDLGRVRSVPETRAIPRAYRRRDAWTTKSGEERLRALRDVRLRLAVSKGVRESQITAREMAKDLGVSEREIRPHLLTLAGDFVPRR